MKSIIVKIGGKVLEDPEHLSSTINQIKKLIFEEKIIKSVVIISGGGSSANLIRGLDNKLNLGDDLAHWMATYTMDYNGLKICEKYPEIECIDDFDELSGSIEKKSIIVFLPYNYFTNIDELPHSWDVTSDSLTLFLAHKLKLDECFLIKNIDGIYIKGQKDVIQEISTNKYRKLKRDNKIKQIKIDPLDLKKTKPIDPFLLELIDKYKINCVILNGSKEELRISEYFKPSADKEKVFTSIKAD